MRLTNAKWSVVTIIVQSLVLLPVFLLLFAIPHMWDSTFVNLLEGKPPPAFTAGVLKLLPASGQGLLAVLALCTLTPLCLGFILIVTATDKLAATQRILFLSVVVWCLALLVFVTEAVALTMPILCAFGSLGKDPDMTGVWDAPSWTITTLVFVTLLVGATVLICRRNCRD